MEDQQASASRSELKKRFIIFSKIGAPVLLLIGFACSFIKWGEPQKLHGEGFPIPAVMWDPAHRYSDDPNIPDDRFLDFVNPLALILNPLIFLLVGFMFFVAIELGLRLFRTIAKIRAT